MRTALRTLGLLLFLFVLLGLALHSIPGGTLLGRWTPRYALGLLLLTGLGWPWWKLLVFLTEDTVFTGSEGQEVRIPAPLKGKVFLTLVLLVFLPVEFALHRRANRRTRKDWKKFHPFLQHQNRPNRGSMHTNSEGFRGEPLTLDKPAGRTRILFLGGSTVYCMRTTWEKTHPRLLEKALRERRPDLDLELQNCGLDWYTTEHSLINWLFRLRDFKPDIVILFHGINDLCRSFSPKTLAYGPPRRDYAHFFGPVARLALGHTRQGQIPHPYTVAWAFDRLLSVVDQTGAQQNDPRVWKGARGAILSSGRGKARPVSTGRFDVAGHPGAARPRRIRIPFSQSSDVPSGRRPRGRIAPVSRTLCRAQRA